jgi:hypothetical protein
MAAVFSSQAIQRGVYLATWSGLANGEAGTPQSGPKNSDRSVQVDGTFGTGGSVSIEGSNDGNIWFTLTDQNGSALTFTSPGLRAILQATVYIRPRVTAGDASTNLNVRIVMVE